MYITEFTVGVWYIPDMLIENITSIVTFIIENKWCQYHIDLSQTGYMDICMIADEAYIYDFTCVHSAVKEQS